MIEEVEFKFAIGSILIAPASPEVEIIVIDYEYSYSKKEWNYVLLFEEDFLRLTKCFCENTLVKKGENKYE